MNTTKLYEIEIDYTAWWSVDLLRELESIFGHSLKTAEREKDPPETASDYTVKTTRASQAKFDQGLRQLSWEARLQIVSEESLSRFLPCRVERVVTVRTDLQVDLVEQRTAPVLNERVQVVVPGPALNSYDSVTVAENCCTDVLQDYLEKGWRILAICVQPDQRRPDYVLGRCSEVSE